MEDKIEFLAKLEEALEARRTYLERNVLPRLRESFHAYQSALQSIVSVLSRKSLIHADPYKHEHRISEITVPSTDPVMDSEKIEQISIRLSEFDSQLDFLNNFYQFSVPFLGLNRIRLLSNLIHYITWEKLSDVSGSINTRLVTELITKVKLGNDKFSIGLLSDAQTQIVKATNEIIAGLRDLTSYHREMYKAAMRRSSLLDGITIDAARLNDDRDTALRTLKLRFARMQSEGKGFRIEGYEDGTPYYPELIGEILDEDFSEYAVNLRRAILEKLAVRETARQKRHDPPLKPLLLDGVRLLATGCTPLDTAMQKLKDNSETLENKKLSFAERLRRWLSSRLGAQRSRMFYEVSITDPATGIAMHEKIDFRAFTEKVAKLSRSLANLSNRMTESYNRLENSDEEKILDFLSSSIDELNEYNTMMPALDAFFRAEFGREEKLRVKGIKLELSAIKNAVLKANQKRHEYLSRKEERAQLKRLGIDIGE